VIAQLTALVTLYARNGVSGVKACDEFRTLVATHEASDNFNVEREMVEVAQTNLEATVACQHSYREQVIQSLKQIRRVRADKSRFPIYRDLVREGYAHVWSDGQRTSFEEACTVLAEWGDFFLSFTSYNPAKPGINPINQDHELLFGVDVGKTRDREVVEKNLLAEYLYGRLLNGGYSGYYYLHDVDPREVIPTLIGRAKRSIAFVQLLQRSMFRRYPDNYCFEEFRAAAERASRALVFVMSEPREAFVAMVDVPDDLMIWHQTALSHAAVVLAPAQTSADVRENIWKIEKLLIGAIEAAHRRLLDSVPPD
jgi:hypothetical protein